MVLLVETKQYPTKDLVMRLSRVSLVELSLCVWIFFCFVFTDLFVEIGKNI